MNTNRIELRMAVPDDAEVLLEIYRPYVESTSISFEYEVPSIEEFTARIEEILSGYPYLVALRGGEVVGYAYAHRFQERAAYQWNAELSIYLREDVHGCGIADRLYDALIELLKAQGVVNVYAVITHPNEKSERFHRRRGFEVTALAPQTGWKFGRWIDVCDMALRILEPQGEPRPVRLITELDAAFVAQVLMDAGECD